MNHRPTPAQLAAEIEAVMAADFVEEPMDQAFVSGLIRGLEWAQGKGMSPSEFLLACQRTPRRH